MLLRMNKGEAEKLKTERERETLRLRRTEKSIVPRINGILWPHCLVIPREVIVKSSPSK